MNVALASSPVQTTADTSAADAAAYRTGKADGRRGLKQAKPWGGEPGYLYHYSRGWQHGFQAYAFNRGFHIGFGGDDYDRPFYIPECFDAECREGHAAGLADFNRHMDELADAADPGRDELAIYYRSDRELVLAGGLI